MWRNALAWSLWLAAVPAVAADRSLWLAVGSVDELDGMATQMASLASAPTGAGWEYTLHYFRPRDAARFPEESRWVLSAARRWSRGSVSWLFGAAVNDRSGEVLSGHVQWLSGVAWRLPVCEVSLRHLSNGSLHGRNRGETWIAVAVPWR